MAPPISIEHLLNIQRSIKIAVFSQVKCASIDSYQANSGDTLLIFFLWAQIPQIPTNSGDPLLIQIPGTPYLSFFYGQIF